MSTSSIADTVLAFLGNLEPERATIIQNAPRHEKVGLLSESLGLSEQETLEQVAESSNIQTFIDFKTVKEATTVLPVKLIHEYQCLPVEPPQGVEIEGQIHLVTVWAPDALMTGWVRAATGKDPIWFLGLPSVITNNIIQILGVGAGSLDDTNIEEFATDQGIESENKDAAIIRFVNEIIIKAIEDRATDIHFEPQKTSLQIRYRIDGELVPVKLPENLVKFQAAIISRLKIMSRLNISEKRRPQDGRIKFSSAGIELDIRLSSLPTMYGESISLRLLSQGSQPVSLQELGLAEDDQNKVYLTLKRPHGIILVTGPTGSGKSTTLGAFVRKVRTPERRIMTVEDPVEYEIEGVNQTQVQSDIGLTFASTLRSILRQDPDVIMIGEIRDRETADIAIRASLTGHLVLSSLHTNDAPGALTRLIDMGIEPFLVASSVEMILAQRLVRRLCQSCAEPAKMDQNVLECLLASLGIKHSELAYASQIKKSRGCENCRHLGYKGRIGIFEVLKLSETIHKMIVQKESARAIRQQAIEEGMKTIQFSAWEQVKRGFTSIDAIMRFAESEEEEQ